MRVSLYQLGAIGIVTIALAFGLLSPAGVAVAEQNAPAATPAATLPPSVAAQMVAPPTSTANPTPTPAPSPVVIYVLPPSMGTSPIQSAQMQDSLLAYLTAAGASPIAAQAVDVVTKKLGPSLWTQVDGSNLMFQFVPAAQGSAITQTIPLPTTLPNSSIASLMRTFAAQSIPPTNTLPTRRYDLVILPDNAINDQSDQETGTTAFSGSAYVESRLQIDLLRWKINATTASTYFTSLTGGGNTEMPTNFIDQVKRLCQTQPGLYILRYSIAYSETAQVFFGTQQGYATLDGVLYHCPGLWNPFNFPNPENVRTDPHHYIGHYTYTIHHRNETTNGKIFPALLVAINAGLNGLRGKYTSLHFLGNGPVVAGSFLQNPSTNSTVTQAVGDASRYMSCATFVAIVSPLVEPTAPPRFTNDNRDREPCPAAQVLFDAYSLEYPPPPYPSNYPSIPSPNTAPTPLSASRIPP